MTLPKSLTTITTFSKLLALFLFILLPLIGFLAGAQYKNIVQMDYAGDPRLRIFSTQEECESFVGRKCLSTICEANPAHISCTANNQKGWFATKQPIGSEPTTSPAPSNETAGWKTYTNKKFNYSLQYPPELIVGNGRDPESAFDSVDNLYLTDVDDNFIDIHHGENLDGLSVDDWLHSDEGRPFNYNNSGYKPLNISSLAWYVFDPPLTFSLDQSAFRWGLFNNSDVFLVGNKTHLSDDTIERILSTFEFIE